MIEEGRVWVNGEKISSPALVISDKDVLKVDGKAVTFHGCKNTLVPMLTFIVSFRSKILHSFNRWSFSQIQSIMIIS
jgi:ribosomal protein S4